VAVCHVRRRRDGGPAECELLFNYADTRVQEFFINGGNPSVELIRNVYLLLRNMANEEGGWEYPKESWDECAALYTKIGGVVKTVTMTDGNPNTYFQDPHDETLHMAG
jgi:hypothetical protein